MAKPQEQCGIKQENILLMSALVTSEQDWGTLGLSDLVGLRTPRVDVELESSNKWRAAGSPSRPWSPNLQPRAIRRELCLVCTFWHRFRQVDLKASTAVFCGVCSQADGHRIVVLLDQSRETWVAIPSQLGSFAGYTVGK